MFTIAFGTADGTITDPDLAARSLPVPVQPAALEQVAEATGGAAYEAATGDELDDAYERIQDSLGETLGEEIEIVKELTWQWARHRPGADRRCLGPVDVVAARHGLTARGSGARHVSRCRPRSAAWCRRVARSGRPSGVEPSGCATSVRSCATGRSPIGLTDRWVTPASL